MNTFIAQTPSVPGPPAPPPALTEWGLLGAIVFYLVKEGVSALKQKDTSEATLTNRLLDEQMQTNKELRKYLETGDRAADKVSRQLAELEPRLARHSAGLLLDQREEFTKLRSMVEAIHTRLDKAGVADSHARKVVE